MTLSKESLETIQEIRRKLPPDQKLVFVSGNFNLLHTGHLRLLRQASELGYLVVGVHPDFHLGVRIPQADRLEAVRAISFVGHAVGLQDEPLEFIQGLRPDMVMKGREHEGLDNPEERLLEAQGGKLIFSGGDTGFANFGQLQREMKFFNHSTITPPRDYPRRHDFDSAALAELIGNFKNVRLAVVGESIIDEYITCDALGMSQEDPTLVVSPVRSDLFAGGAAIVAGHAAGLGARVALHSVRGADATGLALMGLLEAMGVEARVYVDESRPTILKQRFRASGKTLLRVNRLHSHSIGLALQSRLLERILDTVHELDLLIFADFNYGVLPQPLVDRIIADCQAKGVPIVADSQSSSQMGDVSRYKRVQLLTPTEHEARVALRDRDSGLVVLAERLCQVTACENLILKLGSEGVLVHAKSRAREGDWLTDQLMAFNSAPKDTAGAGDSLMVTAALALACGGDIWQSSYLGSLAAACQVGRVGNLPLSAKDLLDEIRFG